MDSVAGSNLGTVHSAQQGYGTGFVLDSAKPEVGAYIQGLKDQAAMREKAQALLQKKKDKNDKFYTDFLKEDFTSPSFKYKEYIDSGVTELQEYSLDLMERGIDLSRDKDWITKRAKVKSDIAAFKGIEAERVAAMKFIAENPDKIEKARAQEVIDFYNQSPEEILKQGGSAPLLKTKTPDYDLLKSTNALNLEIDKIGLLPPTDSSDPAAMAEYRGKMGEHATAALETNSSMKNNIKQILEREKEEDEDAYNNMKDEAEAEGLVPESFWLRNHLINTKSSMSLEEAIATKLPLLLEKGEQFHTDETGAKHQKDPTEHFEAMIRNLVKRNPNGWGVGIKTPEQALEKARELAKTLKIWDTAKPKVSIAQNGETRVHGAQHYWGIETPKLMYVLDKMLPTPGHGSFEPKTNPLIDMEIDGKEGKIIDFDGTHLILALPPTANEKILIDRERENPNDPKHKYTPRTEKVFLDKVTAEKLFGQTHGKHLFRALRLRQEAIDGGEYLKKTPSGGSGKKTVKGF